MYTYIYGTSNIYYLNNRPTEAQTGHGALNHVAWVGALFLAAIIHHLIKR